ncbi:hypothetical protein C8A01DRAFT_42056 [Parachaetomium inaequale]|uniref:Uncharacterized protein n=1 Tax=Parachaetomium inaequale TaxID=2588326 RepID=A0AAN6SL96_9PEZI|nr:hypothetical protein C8A01DRAFT_42056 [Parachaetomium inaequale]
MQPQLSCRIGGKRLVSLMPTLLQQIWRSPGGSRAWTLQEALLSPRTAIGQRPPAQHRRPEKGAWLASRVGDGCLRTPIDITSQRLERYGSKLTLYSYRRMTDQADGLNAFSGILSFLRRMYTGGFHNGLPLEDFQWGFVYHHLLQLASGQDGLATRRTVVSLIVPEQRLAVLQE